MFVFCSVAVESIFMRYVCVLVVESSSIWSRFREKHFKCILGCCQIVIRLPISCIDLDVRFF